MQQHAVRLYIAVKIFKAKKTEEKETGASYILTGDVRGRGTWAHQRKLVAVR